MNLILEETRKTPKVDFNSQSGVLKIKGRSISENALDFYQHLFDFANSYVENPATATEIHIELDYYNTSASKCLLKFLDLFRPLFESNFTVYWHFEEEDEDSKEAGEDFSTALEIPFQFVVTNHDF